MEDILASIKRVIAEDARAPVARSRPRADIDDMDEDDILELDEPMQLSAQALAPSAVPPAAVQPPAVQPAPDASLVSANAAEASRASLAALAALRTAAPAPATPEGGPLEAVVRDMLRPMLKDWLDQRLPAIVEELVAREVARITGKG